MIIDFSKCSPMQRIRIMEAIQRVAGAELNEITTDLQFYTDPDSPTFKEMTGWAQGCQEVKSEAIKIKREALLSK